MGCKYKQKKYLNYLHIFPSYSFGIRFIQANFEVNSGYCATVIYGNREEFWQICVF